MVIKWFVAALLKDDEFVDEDFDLSIANNFLANLAIDLFSEEDNEKAVQSYEGFCFGTFG